MGTTIECPSGLKLVVRALRVSEERILADKKVYKERRQFSALLNACTEEIVDLGPYQARPGTFELDDALAGDRFYALLKIRELTYGKVIQLKPRCPVKMCGTVFGWDVPIEDLPVRLLSEAGAEHVRTGKPLSVTLSNGTTLEYKLLTGRDEQRLALKQNVEDKLLEALLTRVVSISGVEPKGHRAYLDGLTLGEVRELTDAVEEHDCGVETGIEVQCESCGEVFELELPLEVALNPPKKKRS